MKLQLMLLFMMLEGAWPGIQQVHAQFSISGTVTDAVTGKALAGAHVVVDNSYLATTTNAGGKYSLPKIQGGLRTFRVSYIGYTTEVSEIEVNGSLVIDFRLTPSVVMSEEVVVSATRASEKSPTTYSNVSREVIQRENMGQDLPFLIGQIPSTVVTSDAGTGIGYTGIRIRGSDITRINVTVNGIPLNDAESHGVWFVNLPDLASSLENIQVQRGVGTSTNGAAAFGATLNMQTTALTEDPYGEYALTGGSFDTWKNTIRFGTGLLGGRWSVDGRLSMISSDGYIDRAASDLKSFFISGAYHGVNSLVKLNIFSGKEKTYQAWNGIPKVRLESDLEGMKRYEEHGLYTPEETAHMISSDPRTYNLYTYENETDNYQQNHYQLLYSAEPWSHWYLNAAAHYTQGRGYYEQYKADELFVNYGIEDPVIGGDTITETDLVRQKWLDNDFYGFTWAVQHSRKKKADITLGGAWNKYIGDHFGEVIWAEVAVSTPISYEWYSNTGTKTDFTIYGKADHQVTGRLSVYADLQFRAINYRMEGIHDDLRDLTQSHEYRFFNPKAGITYEVNASSRVYISVAVANREPARSSFRDADPGEVPRPERLIDYEAGYHYRHERVLFNATAFYMDYNDQLVLNGEINNVGDPVMINVPDSYRLGLELAARILFGRSLRWDLNAAFSRNKVSKITTYVDDWDNGGQISEYFNLTDLSYSPAITAGSNLTLALLPSLDLSFESQYVGKQYSDITSGEDRRIDPYFVSNVLISYEIRPAWMNRIGFSLKLINIFNEEYESNAWVYRYHYQGKDWQMDGYFPQARFNFLAGITFGF